MNVTCNNGLYYSRTETFITEPQLIPTANRSSHTQPTPTTKAKQIESELWLLRLGSPNECQLTTLPSCTTGLPPIFKWHPFRFIDFKEQAYSRKQSSTKLAHRLDTCGQEFYMDLGFMRSSTADYKRPNKKTDRVVTSYDGYSSYLLIVDGASRRIWVFLTQTKEPPIDILRAFMTKFSIGSGLVRTDQGGELAGSTAFLNLMKSLTM